MAATVTTLSESWADAKPAGYKNQDLDKAIKAYEGLESKAPTMPNNLIPSAPESKIGSIDNCIDGAKNAISELEKAKKHLDQMIKALDAVQKAASKTSAELTKLAKTKKDAEEEQHYKNAASIATFVGGSAGASIKQWKGTR
jgi:hypothetical protein